MTQSIPRPQETQASSGAELDSTALSSALDDAELEATREKYRYNYNHIAPVAMIDRLPKEELPAWSWWLQVLKIMRDLLVNGMVARYGHDEETAKTKVSKLLTQSLIGIFVKSGIKVRIKIIWHLFKLVPNIIANGFRISLGDFESLVQSWVESFEHNLVKMLHLGVKAQVAGQHQSGDEADFLSAYRKQFATLELPAIADYFHEDRCFAYFRIAGPNPVMLERVTHLEDGVLRKNFPVTNEQYQSVMGANDSFEQAIAERRLYLIDYELLSGAVNGRYPEYQKYIDAPLALFAMSRAQDGDQSLCPVAIQCKQQPGDDNPIFLPPAADNHLEKCAWEMAKRVVQTADSNFHEAVTHLGRTHLFMSPFIMATHRQLPKSHPVSLLLRPHFEGTLSINHGAHTMLIAPKGGVDSILASTIDCSRALAAAGATTYGFNSSMLPQQLADHGLDDVEGLPYYPYRDDALLIWDAITDWVSDYVSHYYPEDQAVVDDKYLQAWAHEVQSFDGGRVQEFGEDGKLITCAYLIQALTLMIFTSSAQHAAVNFPQGDMMVYTPAMPLAGYRPAPTETTMSPEAESAHLPPLHQSMEQIELTYLLGQVFHTQLGQYPTKHFANQEINLSLQKFQNRLRAIEAIIDERNQHRPYPYPYLKPSRIPQSINI